MRFVYIEFLSEAASTRVEYDASRHTPSKFLYYRLGDEEILVVGDENMLFHREIDYAYEKTARGEPTGELVGAGTIKHGHVTSWGSSNMKITTPEDLRERIVAELNLHQLLSTT